MRSSLEARGDVEDTFVKALGDELDVAVLNLFLAIHAVSSFAILPVAIW